MTNAEVARDGQRWGRIGMALAVLGLLTCGAMATVTLWRM